MRKLYILLSIIALLVIVSLTRTMIHVQPLKITTTAGGTQFGRHGDSSSSAAIHVERDHGHMDPSATSRSAAGDYVDGGTEAAAADDDSSPSPATTKPVEVRKQSKGSSSKRVGGRDGADHSHMGMVEDEDGIFAAWGPGDENKCHGMSPRAECVDEQAVDWFRKHVLLAIVSGKEGTFRVEVSQCSWLGHFPPENVFIFTDVPPTKPRTPHHWVKGELPSQVEERNGDLFSPYIKKGYVKAVRSAGQGYSAGWIVAQFRFPQAVGHLLDEAEKRKQANGGKDIIKWIMVADDDTIVNINNLVKRLKPMNIEEPWYLSRRGWGGAGHLYSLAAMRRTRAVLDECLDKWMIRQFRASDTMMLKCATHAKLNKQLEHTMSHCPASRAGVDKLLSKDQMTFHGKKDYYPPVILTTFRTGLYYLASYCRDRTAAELAYFYSSCAFGNCKAPHCTKEKDRHRAEVWDAFSRNSSIKTIDWDSLGSVPKK